MIENVENFLANIPTSPGVYIMKDATGRVIYVGKALNLRNRVRSYFRDPGSDTRPGVRFLRKKAANIEVILTDTEKEALILEDSLIKEHRPKYNIDLRDDKSFLSLRLTTKEKFPRLVPLRRPPRGDEPTFGPYASAAELYQTLRLIRDVFPLRTCKPTLFRGRTRPCINHQIGHCLGPCVGLISEEAYGAMIEDVKRFLKGKGEDVVADIEARMKAASDAMEYEQAALYRDQITAIRNTVERQKVIKHGGVDRDIVAFAGKGDHNFAVRLRFRLGHLVASKNFEIKTPGRSREEVSGELIRGLYREGDLVPAEIFIRPTPEDVSAIEDWLTERRGSKVVVRDPQRGEGRELYEMAEKNATEIFEAKLRREFDAEAALADIAARLELKAPPERIECVDISNIGGQHAVGSVVSFLDGEPDRARYRRYKIKSVEGQDDYAMMLEVLGRRLKRGAEEGNLPDLILVDGGKGQLNIAKQAVLDLKGPDTPIAAIAKDRDGKSGDRIFIPGRKNHLHMSSQAIHLLGRVRDEAHRFAIAYHRNLRNRATITSALLEIPGVGPKKRDTLLKRFGSVKKIGEATIEELKETPRLSVKEAEAIYEYTHRQKTDVDEKS